MLPPGQLRYVASTGARAAASFSIPSLHMLLLRCIAVVQNSCAYGTSHPDAEVPVRFLCFCSTRSLMVQATTLVVGHMPLLIFIYNSDISETVCVHAFQSFTSYRVPRPALLMTSLPCFDLTLNMVSCDCGTPCFWLLHGFCGDRPYLFNSGAGGVICRARACHLHAVSCHSPKSCCSTIAVV